MDKQTNTLAQSSDQEKLKRESDTGTFVLTNAGKFLQTWACLTIRGNNIMTSQITTQSQNTDLPGIQRGPDTPPTLDNRSIEELQEEMPIIYTKYSVEEENHPEISPFATENAEGTNNISTQKSMPIEGKNVSNSAAFLYSNASSLINKCFVLVFVGKSLQRAFGRFMRDVGDIYIEENVDDKFHMEFYKCADAFGKLGNIAETILLINPNAISNPETALVPKHFTLKFGYLFDEFEGTLAQALDHLNAEAESCGYRFKIGSSSVRSSQTSFLYLYCKQRTRPLTSTTTGIKNITGFKDSQDNKNNDEKETTKKKKVVNSKKKTIESERCMAYLSFKVVKIERDGTRLVRFFTENPLHCHGAERFEDITQDMIAHMSLFRRRRPISEILNSLERTFPGRNLSYAKVYYQFRKLHPRLGPKDLDFFCNYLSKKNSITVTDKKVETTCKLLFFTEIMLQNYLKYSDILLIDSTYNTNKYHIPLLVFTGISSTAKNVLFGLCLMNEEDTESYVWAIEMFFEKTKRKPNLIVTDEGSTFMSALPRFQIDCLICQWHVSRNLRKHFGYLNTDNQELYQAILALPYEESQLDFENTYEKAKDFFKKQSYKLSLEYIERIYKTKEKWSKAFRKKIFTAGTVTTSRAESMNACIKRYVNANSEISALVQFIEDIESHDFFEDPFAKKTETVAKYNNEPICLDLQNNLSSILYRKHLDQFKEASLYENETVSENEETIEYRIWHDAIKPEDQRRKSRKLFWSKSNVSYSCSCELFDTEGVICRHAFHIARIKNLKSMKVFIHPRWNSIVNPITHSFSQLEKKELGDEDRKREREELAKEKEVLANHGLLMDIEQVSEESGEEDMTENEETKINKEDIKREIVPNFAEKVTRKGMRVKNKAQKERKSTNENELESEIETDSEFEIDSNKTKPKRTDVSEIESESEVGIEKPIRKKRSRKSESLQKGKNYNNDELESESDSEKPILKKAPPTKSSTKGQAKTVKITPVSRKKSKPKRKSTSKKRK